MLTRIARTCYRRRWRVAVGWVVFVVALSALGSALASEYRLDLSLPGSETDAASDLLERAGSATVPGSRASSWSTPPMASIARP